MHTVSRATFLTLPTGTTYIEVSPYGLSPAVKGPTDSTEGSFRFQKRVVRPDTQGKMEMVSLTQDVDHPQAEYTVLDEVEMLACLGLIFQHVTEWTPRQYAQKVERLMETFAKMPNIQLTLPGGKKIMGDGSPVPSAPGNDTKH